MAEVADADRVLRAADQKPEISAERMVVRNRLLHRRWFQRKMDHRRLFETQQRFSVAAAGHGIVRMDRGAGHFFQRRTVQRQRLVDHVDGVIAEIDILIPGAG